MAIWKVSNSVPKSLAEREIWTHPDKGEVVRETLFRHGAYLVVTEDDSPPEFEREAVPEMIGVVAAANNACAVNVKHVN